MFEDNIFDDGQSPYHYLSLYEDQCWLQHIIDQSKTYFDQANTNLQETIMENVDLQKKEIVRQTSRVEDIRNCSDKELIISSQNPEEETMVFEPMVFHQPRKCFEEEFEDNISQIEEERAPIQQRNEYQRIKNSSQQILTKTFNTIDYIIKHCFKRMLSPLYQKQIMEICEQQKSSYSSFRSFWSKRLQKKRPSTHIGLNKFKEMIEQVQKKQVRICREFFTLYLWRDYAQYVTYGSMLNKQQYLRCASKLMYISNPKGRDGVSIIECSQTMSK